MSNPMRVLRLDASANPGESSSKKLGDSLIRRLQQTGTADRYRARAAPPRFEPLAVIYRRRVDRSQFNRG
jgi:hypothetical protein